MKRLIINKSLPAHLHSISQLRKLLVATLPHCMPLNRAYESIALCASEVLTNCVEHSTNATRIQLQLFSDNYGWWIDIKDNGNPFDINEISKKLEPDINNFLFDGENEGGRGLGLITTLAETIQLYCNTGTHNTPNIEFFSHPHQRPLIGVKQSNISINALWYQTWNNGIRLGWKHQKQQKTLLIVDDDPSLIALYRIYLQKKYHIISAENGQQALNYLAQNTIDLVISDITMPIMSGIELRQQLNKQHKELIPFIFLSMADDERLLELANSLGIDDYLHKPITKDILLQTVERVLTRSQYLITRLGERINKEISSALAPTLPAQFKEWTVNYQTRNTGLGGGDFVIFHEYEDTTALVLVDIMGHSDVSKFFSYAYGGYIKGLLQAHPNGLAPHRLLEILSQHIYDDSLLGKTTLTCIALSLSSNGKITLACAGHPPPIRITKDSCEALPVNGMLAGLLPDIDYSSVEITLAKDEKIAIYTDGLFEACDNADQRDLLQNVMLNQLELSSKRSGKDSIQQIFASFDELTDQQPTDDTLLILLQPNALQEELT